MLSAFPNLITKEFEQACSDLRQRYRRRGNEQHEWQSVEMLPHLDSTWLRITKNLRSYSGPAQLESEQNEMEEDDDEVLQVVPDSHAVVIHYDVLFSPVYRVPVLYFGISDPQHRYPPTMTTLYEHLIAPSFKAQTKNGGVIGGVTINDHPITNRPAFFIHPCQTAEVMEASVGEKLVTPEQYLIMWIGALGKCVGFNIPLALMQPTTADTGSV